MKTSKDWIAHFRTNAREQRIDWNQTPSISPAEIEEILPSLQAWQLGETSDGRHLIQASSKYAKKINDYDYIDAVKLFIAEEQKHGNNLGAYLDVIKKPRIKQNWGDTLFRKIRYYNANMEIWTVAVITVESAAQIFYQCLKDASGCILLKEICTDILIDEAYHIDFQTERLQLIFQDKSSISKLVSRVIYPVFFFTTSTVIWLAHKKAFKAGNINFKKYLRKMRYKYLKTLNKVVSNSSTHTITPKPLSVLKPHQFTGA
ncbi:MAG: ferritin-like domain-containing protein [Agriterribacter sp.]